MAKTSSDIRIGCLPPSARTIAPATAFAASSCAPGAWSIEVLAAARRATLQAAKLCRQALDIEQFDAAAVHAAATTLCRCRDFTRSLISYLRPAVLNFSRTNSPPQRSPVTDATP